MLNNKEEMNHYIVILIALRPALLEKFWGRISLYVTDDVT